MKKAGIILAFVFSVIVMSCGVSNKSVKRLQQMEEGVSSPTTIEEYKTAINKYEKRVADIELAQEQIGIWYKILGSRYLDRKMYGEALKCYQKALLYYPANQNLYYYVGVCAGYMAHTTLDYDGTGGGKVQRFNYLKLSESAYLQAISIENSYVRALYGLGVLYVFELDESAKAIPYLEKLLIIDKGHTDAMFVLARAYYTNSEFDKAAAVYEKIVKTSKDPQKRKEAEENKKTVLDASYAK
jgi:tetratricopeptide (TPR) repeat protein